MCQKCQKGGGCASGWRKMGVGCSPAAVAGVVAAMAELVACAGEVAVSGKVVGLAI